jgi:hypothetical protein
MTFGASDIQTRGVDDFREVLKGHELKALLFIGLNVTARCRFTLPPRSMCRRSS